MKEIRYGMDTVVLVDDEDYDRVKNGPYYVHKRPPYGVFKSVSAHFCRFGNSKRCHMELSRILMNCPDDMVVDHINGNRFDNRKKNLRICTQKQNMQNMRTTKQKVGLKGVRTWGNGKFGAKIVVNGKPLWLGTFNTSKEAALAYDAAARKHFGEFACTNYPPSQSKPDSLH
jgi:hypothetical protein